MTEMRATTVAKLGRMAADDRERLPGLENVFNRTSQDARNLEPRLRAAFGNTFFDGKLLQYRATDARVILSRAVLQDERSYPAKKIQTDLRDHADKTGGSMRDFAVDTLFAQFEHAERVEIVNALKDRGFHAKGMQIQGFRPPAR